MPMLSFAANPGHNLLSAGLECGIRQGSVRKRSLDWGSFQLRWAILVRDSDVGAEHIS
jgi:hypothetical protein